jgi:hypothetical protein
MLVYRLQLLDCELGSAGAVVLLMMLCNESRRLRQINRATQGARHKLPACSGSSRSLSWSRFGYRVQ